MDVMIYYLFIINFQNYLVINIASISKVSLTITRANGVLNSFLISSDYDTSIASSQTIDTINLGISGTLPDCNFSFLNFGTLI